MDCTVCSTNDDINIHEVVEEREFASGYLVVCCTTCFNSINAQMQKSELYRRYSLVFEILATYRLNLKLNITGDNNIDNPLLVCFEEMIRKYSNAADDARLDLHLWLNNYITDESDKIE